MLVKKRSTDYFWVYVAVLVILGLVFYSIGFNDCQDIKYSYNEDNSIDYKVYLKENNFFDQPFLGKDKTYITSLIDHLVVDYKYKVLFNTPVDGELKYHIVATVSAEKTNNQVGTYWEKSFNLTDIRTKYLFGEEDCEISESINIDYQKYNELLLSFVDTYNLSSDGFLKLALVVDGKPQVSAEDTIPVNSEISVKIPLSKVAVEGVINTDQNNKQKEITRKVRLNDLKHIIFKILFLIDIFGLFYVVFKHFVWLAKNKKLDSYNGNVIKITNDYGSIMVKVKELKLSKFNLVEVSSFDDLLVVYNDVRTPINYVQEKNRTRFVIIFEHMAWEYVIEKEDYDE